MWGFFVSHIPVMQPAPLWNPFTANHMLAYPGMDGYSSDKDGDSLGVCDDANDAQNNLV